MPFDPTNDGRIFVCQMCGDCCKGYGGTYVSDEDIERIARFIGVDPAYLLERYCQISGGKPLLAQADSGYCVFWDQNRMCTIHPVKPAMCKAWPFLESVLIDMDNWLMMAQCCPGIRTNVPEHWIKKVIQHKLPKS
jgi:Fe-S-cluster containining protein